MHFLHCILDNTQKMTSEKPTLYSYFRSSCSWRVRIALNLKKIEYEYAPINLLKGEQKSESYLSINPLGGLPTLKINDHYISQSISIMEYLDEVYPEVPLLPKNDPCVWKMFRKDFWEILLWWWNNNGWYMSNTTNIQCTSFQSRRFKVRQYLSYRRRIKQIGCFCASSPYQTNRLPWRIKGDWAISLQRVISSFHFMFLW